MRRTLSNRTVAVLVAVFTVACAVILHSNPFGSGQISWPGAILVSLAGNAVLAYLLASWAAPYMVSTGGSAGAEKADPHAVTIAEDWIAATLMSFGVVALLAVSFASSDLIISPTERTQKNAELVKRTVEAQAPEEFQPLLTAADTWKMSEKTLRTCVPSSVDEEKQWCVLVHSDTEGDELKVVRAGPGISNAAQFLEWHPEYKGKRRAD